MDIVIGKFIKKLFVYSIIAALISLGISYLLPAKLVTSSWPFLIVFFTAITLVGHLVMIKAMSKKMAHFVNYFMILLFVKLMIYAVIIVIYALINRGDAVNFIFTFFIYYLFYTIFELISVLKLQK